MDTGVMYVHKRQWIGLREVILRVWSTSHYCGHLMIFKDQQFLLVHSTSYLSNVQLRPNSR